MRTIQYKNTLNLIKKEIHSAKIQVAKVLTYEHISLYFKIGEIISNKQKELNWGKSVVETTTACRRNIKLK